MAVPFEEPTKIEMRAECEIAIDQAGHQLVEKPVPIAIGAAGEGRVKGDMQSLDSDGNRYCYYLRPRTGDALPEWLAELAAAAHSVPDVKAYVVVRDASPTFEKACKAAGAGLLLLTSDAEFTTILNFDETLPETLEEALREAISTARRDLEMKLDLHQRELQARFEKIGELTQGMAPTVAEQYVKNVERQYKIWTEWGDETSARLDSALASRNLNALADIEAAIEEGPVLDDDV